MTIRTEEETRSELARLVVLKPTVIEFNAFGDSNHRSIQACIDVLMYDYSRIEIVQRHGDDENALLHPILTRDWLDGLEPEPPSGWGWPLADDADPVVGHKTFRDGPLRASEVSAIMASKFNQENLK